MGKLIVPLIIGLLMGISGGGFFAVYRASAAHATALVDARKHGLKPSSDSTQVAAGESIAHGDSEHAAADTKSAGPDSTPAPVAAAGAVAKHAEPAPVEVAHDPVAEHASATRATPEVTKPSGAVAAGARAVAAAAPTTGGAPTETEIAAHQRRLAKIFATMSPKDASRVLTQMTDHDVSIILGLLSDRQAAAILTSLPAPRAATLSQLQPRRGGGTQ